MALAPQVQAQAQATAHGHAHAQEAEPAAAATAPMAALRAVLEDEVREYQAKGKTHQRWQTFWVLNWSAVEGAEHYEISYKTSEGTSRKVTQLDKPPLRLEVAKGDHPKSGELLARTMQLTTIQGMLSVRVTAQSANRKSLAQTPWMQVGAPYPTP